MRTATLYLLVGLPGSGKTTRARQLAVERCALRLTPDEWMIPLFGELEAGGKRDVLEARVIAMAVRAISIGADVILDFGLWSKDERSALRAVASSVGAESVVIYLPIDAATERSRVEHRLPSEPGSTSAMTEAELARYTALFDAPDAEEISGSRLDEPPAGWGSWQGWACDRWPSLTPGELDAVS